MNIVLQKAISMNRVLWLIFILVWMGCSPKIGSYSGKDAFKSDDGKPNYAKLEYWAAHPNKWDPSDTVPLPLKSETALPKVADVFFLHPTTLTGVRENGITNAAIDDSIINRKTDYTSILYQASVFNERARVFAPRYRQAHIAMYGEKDSTVLYSTFNRAYADVRDAFLYYLKNENKGRPIIIASHSQGTTHATRLIKEFFDGKPLQKQLVCAYLIGMGVKKSEYSAIPVCQDGSETGCFVSWRTFRQDYEDGWAKRTDTGIAVVNPVTWKTNDQIAPASMHQGAILYNLKKMYPQTHQTQAQGGALWISRPKFPGSFLYKSKNYHAGDINLFYVDIRKDVSNRLDRFLQSK
ncbi:MAG: hypothetical protein RL131_1455 [Bacteroidota bacterium]